MATVTVRYRCPVTPEECPSSPNRGFCQIHEWEQLVPERVYLEAGTDDADGAAGTAGAGAAPRDGGAAGTGAAAPGDTPAAAGATAPDDTGRRRSGGARQEGGAAAQRAASRSSAARSTPAQSSPARSSAAGPSGHGVPTRVQAPPVTASPPGPGAPRRGPVPVTPQLALVLAGALIPVRGPEQGSTELGRDAPDCAHVPGLADLDQLSRRHAELTWHAGMLYVADIGSSNGTYVDGVRITRPVQLWPGTHRLQLAQEPEAVEFVLVELDEYGAPR
ncbi:FHA domain-containing protein [Streptomyces sp. NPDC018610]|uniref:FHA domain-containing protein n=1 Tax=Streptomyces sp. NPDC018610 TaxID=3365049 RepID=UPI0037AD7B89